MTHPRIACNIMITPLSWLLIHSVHRIPPTILPSIIPSILPSGVLAPLIVTPSLLVSIATRVSQ